MKITNFKNIFPAAALGLAILAGGATAANGQETQQTQPQADQKTEKQWKRGNRGEGLRRGGKFARHGRGGEMRLFAQLNLTDAQKEQIKQIHQRFGENSKAQREQLRASGAQLDQTQREQLRAQRKAAHEQLQAEILNILTAEQKTQLEQLREQRRQQFEQRKQLFEQRRRQRQAQPAPTVN